MKAYDELARKHEDLSVLNELAQSEDDQSVEQELKDGVATLRARVEELEVRTLLGGEYDERDAIVTLHAGAGGTESQDWAEHGVHRLVRISPFDANKRRHTSFAAVDVVPLLDDEDVDFEIPEKDLKIDVYRSSGPGGQSVNTTDSAVRITHLPTGIVVTSQNERSQLQNKAVSMRVLKARLVELMHEERADKLEELRGERRGIDFGSQIRSYVLAPYQMVKDVRTDNETSNVDAVLDGDIDRFIRAFLEWQRKTAARPA